MKTIIDRDWAALAREGKDKVPEGAVYIGFGQAVPALDEFFIHHTDIGSGATYGYFGSLDDEEFYCKIPTWEKATGLNYEKTMNPTIFNTDRDWAALAKEGKEMDLDLNNVYIGNGCQTNPLSKIFGRENIGSISRHTMYNYSGDVPGISYLAKIEAWEKITGLNYEIIMKTEEIVEKPKFNTSRDWAALAKQLQTFPEVVYIGKGDGTNPLNKIFGDRIRSDDHQNRLCTDAGFMGNVPIYDYFIDIPKWEEVTGLKFSDIKMKNFDTSRDWAALAQKKVSDGYVFIGPGGYEKPLKNTFASLREQNDPASSWVKGNSPGMQYMAEISDWEEVTGLKFSEINKTETKTTMATQVIRTKNSPTLLPLVIEITANKIISYPFNANHSKEYLYSYLDGRYVGSSPDSDFSGCEITEASKGEFIAFLENLPEKRSQKNIALRGVAVTITPDKVVAGCQEYTHAEIEKIAEKVEEFQKAKTLRLTGRKTITIDNNGIHADGVTVSFEELAQVKTALLEK